MILRDFYVPPMKSIYMMNVQSDYVAIQFVEILFLIKGVVLMYMRIYGARLIIGSIFF